MDIVKPTGEAHPLGSTVPAKKTFIYLSSKKTFLPTSSLNLHIKIHSNAKLHTCDTKKFWAEKYVRRRYSLLRHLKAHNRIDIESSRLECDGYFQVFTLKDNLSQISMDINITPKEFVRLAGAASEDAEKKIYACSTCVKVLRTSSNL